MNTKLGITMKVMSKQRVSIIRTTRESRISVVLEDTKRKPYIIRTGISFFNHMLTGIASRACLNMDIFYKPTEAEPLDHVIVEDTGLTLGRAVREMLDARQTDGVEGRGTATVAFDEALVTVTLAFDGRAYAFFHNETRGSTAEHVEDMLSTSLRQFFDGFAQGSGCAVHVWCIAGQDAHHFWEAAFKSFGEALRESLSPCSYRAGTTIGLKGTGMEQKL